MEFLISKNETLVTKEKKRKKLYKKKTVCSFTFNCLFRIFKTTCFIFI